MTGDYTFHSLLNYWSEIEGATKKTLLAGAKKKLVKRCSLGKVKSGNVGKLKVNPFVQ